MHHIISDGWSLDVLIREWVEIYDTLSKGEKSSLAPLPIQYTDYAAWQRNWLQGEVLQGQLNYWKAQLQGAPELLQLPTDFPRPTTQSYRGAQLFTQVEPQLFQQLQDLSRQQGCTLFMTLLTAFNVLLYRYTGQSDIPIGSPIANRTQSKVENLIGFFVNTLILRTQIPADISFTQLLKGVRQTTLDAFAHQDIPFEHLVEQLNPQRSTSHNPLFQVMFAGQNNQQTKFHLSELDIQPLAQDFPTTKFDLSLHAFYNEDGIDLWWEYAIDLFEPERIQRMSEHFTALLQQIVSNPDADIHRFALLSETENQQLLQWSQTETDPTIPNHTIVDLFQAQVDKTPNNIAVLFEDQQFTYSQLNQRANQLAHHLKQRCTIEADTLIAICVERSVNMIIGLLAILKAGG
ncbi:MAG: condensation domain-containing protein, partial [Psychrosphaera sp.]|nr:condensation domain-containing protein [Psychrosphaera sp.]